MLRKLLVAAVLVASSFCTKPAPPCPLKERVADTCEQSCKYVKLCVDSYQSFTEGCVDEAGDVVRQKELCEIVSYDMGQQCIYEIERCKSCVLVRDSKNGANK